MDSGQILSWAVGAVGITGFFLAGKKIWWAWYVNLACQALWLAYGIVTTQPVFIITAAFYTWVFAHNARNWTKAHFNKKLENNEVANIQENA